MERPEEELAKFGSAVREALAAESSTTEAIQRARAGFLQHFAARGETRGGWRRSASASRWRILLLAGATAAGAVALWTWTTGPLTFQVGASGTPGQTGDLVRGATEGLVPLQFSEGSSVILHEGTRLRVLATDARGQFVANFAEPHYHQRLPAAVGSLFREPAGLASRLPAFYQDLLARLEPELRAVDFTGPIGLDALVYRDDHGGVRLKPVVEINPRYTLGRVLVELMRTACQNSAGLLRLVNPAQLRAAGVADFPAYARALAENFSPAGQSGPA